MEIYKVIVYRDYITIVKNVSTKKNWLLGYITTCFEHKTITLIKEGKSGVRKERNYVKDKLRNNPASSTSKTYEVKLSTANRKNYFF